MLLQGRGLDLGRTPVSSSANTNTHAHHQRTTHSFHRECKLERYTLIKNEFNTRLKATWLS